MLRKEKKKMHSSVFIIKVRKKNDNKHAKRIYIYIRFGPVISLNMYLCFMRENYQLLKYIKLFQIQKSKIISKQPNNFKIFSYRKPFLKLNYITGCEGYFQNLQVKKLLIGGVILMSNSMLIPQLASSVVLRYINRLQNINQINIKMLRKTHKKIDFIIY